jgi:hypothetical protein
MVMNHSIVERVDSALNSLEDAIARARQSLAERPNSQELLQRLSSYEEMCKMQRRFAIELANHLAQDCYAEAARCASLINGLSAMIMDDVRVIVASLAGVPTTVDQPEYN